jgi:hypothetical protein
MTTTSQMILILLSFTTGGWRLMNYMEIPPVDCLGRAL